MMMKQDESVLGGRGNAWCYGALVKGRVVYTEEVDVGELEAALQALAAEVGCALVCVIPTDDAAEEAASVIGIPLSVAVLDDDAGADLTVEVPQDAWRRAEREVPAAVWARLAEQGFEPDDGADALYLAPGGWSQVRLHIGERQYRAFAENDPPAVQVSDPGAVAARLRVASA